MSLFAVIREAGPAWTAGGTFDQPGVNEHAAFMNTLVDDGFALFGGPLAGTEQGRIRVLLIFNSPNEAEIRSRLAEDPWASTERLAITSIEPWNIFVGADRMSSLLPSQ